MKVNTFFIIAQILGALVFILNIVGHAKLTTKKVYLYNSICNALSIAQYSLLGAWSGALCCLIALIRNFVFGKYKNKVPLYILLIYISVVILLNFKLIHNVLDLIPVINIIIYAIALWTKDIMNIKIIGVFTCIIGIIYDYTNRAYVTVLNEIIDGIVGIRCISILNKKKKRRGRRK